MIKYFLLFFTCTLGGVQVTKGGLIPQYKPYELGIVLFFLPYNPNIVLIGDQISPLANSLAQVSPYVSLYCFTPDQFDFKQLIKYQALHSNISSFFAVPHKTADDECCYYAAREAIWQEDNWFSRVPGSCLPPCDPTNLTLWGEIYEVPTFSLRQFCEERGLSKIHFLHLSCGGEELQLLESLPHIVDHAIAVFTKTYHAPLRIDQYDFQNLHQFMLSHGYELMTHYIYDQKIGDALYVKSKYITAVFRTREI